MKTSQIRKAYLDFFVSKEHTLFASDGIVPQADPTVLFTSAGMNQFKDYFMGVKKGIKRACSVQKCLRTDDMDKVGKTPYHHTFFEMLGNFSFGDYFKKEAIEWGYEFVTEVLDLKKEDLWISVYEDDREAFDLWHKDIGFPEDKIVKLGAKTNFWPANAPQDGPNGPCGPCSEIFFDKGPKHGCGRPDCSPACDCGRFVEIWNLVFTEFNRRGVGDLEKLPQKNIDTGMGLERVAAVMQDKDSNFQIDVFAPVVDFVKSNVRQVKDDSSVYAIADHLRAVVFAIGDGIIPSNESRGYVIRKLIRRSLVYSYMMKKTKPYLYKGVYVIADVFGDTYKDIQEKKNDISMVVKAEEEKFLSNLQNSRVYIDEILNTKKEGDVISGEDIFRLYDTYGIPPEVLNIFSEEKSVTLDSEVFEKILNQRQDQDRKKSKFEGEVFSAMRSQHSTEFLGYTQNECEAAIKAIFSESNDALDSLKEGEEGKIVLDKTVFYGESGGQVGDTGLIENKDEKSVFQVLDTQRYDETIIHTGKVVKGSFRIEEAVICRIDVERREGIKRAHTATHLLQFALRKVLGSHIKQAGSLVEEDRFRFDFSHFKALTPEEIEMVEESVNGFILENLKVDCEVMPLWEAKKTDALAFFEDKYEEDVRVIKVGTMSKELCGGTHLDCTGKIGVFKIVKEQALQSGVRRIEAFVGRKALKDLNSYKGTVDRLSAQLKTPRDMLLDKVQQILVRMKKQEKLLKDLDVALFSKSIKDLDKELKSAGSFKLLFKSFKDKDVDVVRRYMDVVKGNIKENAVVSFFLDNSESKNILIYTHSKAGSGVVAAKDILLYLEKEFGIRGGGKKEFVQAGVPQDVDPERVFGKIKEFINQKCDS